MKKGEETMKTENVIEKGYSINLNRIDEGFLYSEETVTAINFKSMTKEQFIKELEHIAESGSNEIRLGNLFDLVIAQDRESRWISIHKKTPKRGELGIVTNIEDKDNIWVCCGYLHKNGLWYNQFETPKSDADIIPTHWQPLPEPPKQLTP